MLLAGACVLTYYFHVVFGIGTVFTHFFYIPIVLAAIWWRRKGLIVAVFSSAFLIFSYVFLRPDVATADDYFRALMFIVIAFVVAKLSEHIAKDEEALRSERDNFVNILNSMEDGVYIVDQNHNIQYVNPVLMKDFGPFKGRKCYEYFGDRDEACPWCKNKDVIAGKTVRWE